MLGDIKEIIIFFNEDRIWVAKEIWESGVTLFGRGKTPKEALNALDKVREDFEIEYFGGEK